MIKDSNRNIFFVLAITIIAGFFYYFYDVTTESYVSKPEEIVAGDLEFSFELEGFTYDLAGRLRYKSTSPYGVYVVFGSDIPLSTVKIKAVTVTSDLTKEKYTFLDPKDTPIDIEFEATEEGSKAIWSSPNELDIPFSKHEVLSVFFSFEVNINGSIDFQEKKFKLYPFRERVQKLLTPAKAKEAIEKMN